MAFRAQAVAGFYLYTGHAFCQQRAQAEQRLFQQQRFDGDAGFLNGGDAAAALGGYLNVDYAVQPLCKFAAKVAARYQMGMAVHQARSDDFAVEFHPIIGDQRGQ